MVRFAAEAASPVKDAAKAIANSTDARPSRPISHLQPLGFRTWEPSRFKLYTTAGSVGMAGVHSASARPSLAKVVRLVSSWSGWRVSGPLGSAISVFRLRLEARRPVRASVCGHGL